MDQCFGPAEFPDLSRERTPQWREVLFSEPDRRLSRHRRRFVLHGRRRIILEAIVIDNRSTTTLRGPLMLLQQKSVRLQELLCSQGRTEYTLPTARFFTDLGHDFPY